MIKQYLQFAIKYKKIAYKTNRNLDIKLNIWKYYRYYIAIDIIKKFISKNLRRCDECLTIRWKLKPSLFSKARYNFYTIDACNAERSYISDEIYCCSKIVCYPDCRFNMKCKNCKTLLYNVSPSHLPTDQGWNPIEGKEYISIGCYQCDCTNIINLIFNNCKH